MCVCVRVCERVGECSNIDLGKCVLTRGGVFVATVVVVVVVVAVVAGQKRGKFGSGVE